MPQKTMELAAGTAIAVSLKPISYRISVSVDQICWKVSSSGPANDVNPSPSSAILVNSICVSGGAARLTLLLVSGNGQRTDGDGLSETICERFTTAEPLLEQTETTKVLGKAQQ